MCRNAAHLDQCIWRLNGHQYPPPKWLQLIFLNSADGLSAQSRPPSHRMCSRKKFRRSAARVAEGCCAQKQPRRGPPARGAACASELLWRAAGSRLSCFLRLSHFSAVAKKDLAVPGDCRSRIMGSVIDSKSQHFLIQRCFRVVEERSTCSHSSLFLTNSHDTRHPQSNNAGYTGPKEVQTGEDNDQLQNTR